MENIARLITKYNLQSLLAPAIIDRTWHSQFTGETLFIEKSYEAPHFMSVITKEDLLPAEPAETENVIITS